MDQKRRLLKLIIIALSFLIALIIIIDLVVYTSRGKPPSQIVTSTTHTDLTTSEVYTSAESSDHSDTTTSESITEATITEATNTAPPTPSPTPSETLPTDFSNGLLDTAIDWLYEKGVNMEQISFVYRNLESGEVVSYREDARYTAASTIKLVMNLYTYDQIQAGTILPGLLLQYNREMDYEAGSGGTSQAEDGEEFPIVELLRRSIVYSDNAATNMIFRYWRERPESLSLSTRMDQAYGINYSDNGTLSAAEGDLLLNHLISNPNANPYYELLEEHMRQSIVKNLATDQIPGTVDILNKYGRFGQNLHDIGLVYENGAYSFSIYSYGQEGSRQLLSDLGYMFYIYHQNSD